ncbi:unnamed protein product [Heterotrigona itama]|uniref:VPS9 domain-containing protein n=1 Tax=Heterotrigona itama TaxID=395501 RepID=A0A6V7HAA6_9HYME|nr:unnamed protein product [Heterotrigona itama]
MLHLCDFLWHLQNFVVRQSSQSDTMALSVRLPPGKGPYIEHYLIQANKGKLSLETSENRFDNIPSLIAHYSHDELPVQLTLPRAMREAKNRQQLSSLALLGQEFWRYPMANPKPPESSSSNTSSLSSFRGGSSSPIGALTTTTFASSLPRQPRPTPPNTLNLTTFNEPLDLKKEKISPSDKLSQKLISPNLVQSVRCPSPVVHNVESNVLSPVQDTKVSFESKTTAETSKSTVVELSRTRFSSVSTSMTNFHQNVSTFNNLSCTTSPVLPEIRNIITENHTAGQNVKTPPPPPPRWAKPGIGIGQNQSNFNVTTTVTFSVNHISDVGSSQNTPSDPNTSLLSPQSATSNKSLISNFSVKSPLSPTTPVLSPMSKLVPNIGSKMPNVLSPTTPSSTSKSKRRRDREARKNSQHYQESDILESYYRSSPGDKISDYEDIWNTTDQSNHSTWSPNDKLARNDGPTNHQDRLRNSNDRLMVPDRVINPCSERNFNERLPANEQLIVRNDRMIVRNDKSIGNEKLSYKEMTSPEFSSFKPVQEVKPVEQSNAGSANSLNSPSTVTPPRNKLGLMLAKSESNSPLTPESKQGSPFYAEPADAIAQNAAIIPRRRPRNNPATNKYRHSEPGWLQTPVGANSNQLHPIDWEESEETEDKTPLISSSVDNLAKRLGTKETKKIPRAKPVQPPKIRTKVFNDTSWAVDSSWEFIDLLSLRTMDRSTEVTITTFDNACPGNEGDDCEPDYDCDADYEGDNVARKFPDEECDRDVVGNTLTVQSIILQRYPELLKPPDTSESLYSDRNSSYDNVEKRNEREEAGDTRKDQTYDSSEWETPLETDESDVERMKRNKSFKEPPPRLQALRNRDNTGTGSTIRSYALQLAADKTTTFSQNIDNFIQCTKEGKEASPHVVMRNIRQFMSGMKNYLVKHGEREFEKEVEKERIKLKPNEFLNLDAILEGVMMSLVVRPLREHVYRLFIEHYVATGSLQTLAENIQHAQGKHIQDLGVRPKIIPPSEASLELILKYIDRLQKADSPLDKLENLLGAISAIFNSVKHANSGKHVTLGADDLLPLLVWVLVRGKVVAAEVEAEYMWGLLHPSLLTGEGGYYLTTLSSAVHVLKMFKSSQGTMSTLNGCGTPDCSSVLRILVPDELHGSLNTRTLPVRPNMNTREICRILAHKIRCTNPQDYGLFKLKPYSVTTNVHKSSLTAFSLTSGLTRRSPGRRPVLNLRTNDETNEFEASVLCSC